MPDIQKGPAQEKPEFEKIIRYTIADLNKAIKGVGLKEQFKFLGAKIKLDDYDGSLEVSKSWELDDERYIGNSIFLIHEYAYVPGLFSNDFKNSKKSTRKLIRQAFDDLGNHFERAYFADVNGNFYLRSEKSKRIFSVKFDRYLEKMAQVHQNKDFWQLLDLPANLRKLQD